VTQDDTRALGDVLVDPEQNWHSGYRICLRNGPAGFESGGGIGK
jgi:hypothetical protein